MSKELESRVRHLEAEMKILRGVLIRALKYLGLEEEPFLEILDEATKDQEIENITNALVELTGIESDDLEGFKIKLVELPPEAFEEMDEKMRVFVDHLMDAVKEEANVH